MGPWGRGPNPLITYLLLCQSGIALVRIDVLLALVEALDTDAFTHRPAVPVVACLTPALLVRHELLPLDPIVTCAYTRQSQRERR